MLVKTTVHETKKIEKNIELPYHSKSDGTFYRINEDESVLSVSIYGDWNCNMGLQKKPKYSPAYSLDRAVAAEPCSAEEVENAVRQYLEFVHSTVEMLAETV